MGIERFITAQMDSHQQVIQELQQGYKRSCWMWFTFPQIRGLGYSPTSKYYAIQDLEELQNYTRNRYLRNNLRECIDVILSLPTDDAIWVFGEIDAKKLQSSMTLFWLIPDFRKKAQRVLDKYFNGELDQVTIDILTNNMAFG